MTRAEGDCENCGAPNAKGVAQDGRLICCAHCLFNPLGCRCKYGESGVAETQQDYGFSETVSGD